MTEDNSGSRAATVLLIRDSVADASLPTSVRTPPPSPAFGPLDEVLGALLETWD
jgi:hypothetical protein